MMRKAIMGEFPNMIMGKFPARMSREDLANLEAHRSNEYPDTNLRVWRYVDFSKFISLIQYGELFFSAASRLSDRFEGSASRENHRSRPDTIRDVLEQIRDYLDGDGVSEPKIQEELERIAALYQNHYELEGNLRRWIAQWTYVNCWHASEHESAAMWRLYSASDKESIAVQSTFGRLHGCLKAHMALLDGDPHIGLVRYIDYEEEQIPPGEYARFFCKRRSFEHERELRAVVQRLPTIPVSYHEDGTVSSYKYDYDALPTPGISLKVDVRRLIERLVIAPTAEDWFAQLVRDVCSHYGLDVPVHKSSLDAEPIY